MLRRALIRRASFRDALDDAMRSSMQVAQMEVRSPKPKRGVAPGPGVAGMSGQTLSAPETVSGTLSSVKEVFTPPTKEDIVEAIGWPGQQQASGGIAGLARLNYGPGRYDYGRVQMPKSWFANYFYPAWEFGHLLFVADKWFLLRQFRHIFGIGFFFFPLWLTAYYNVKMHEEGPPWLRNK